MLRIPIPRDSWFIEQIQLHDTSITLPRRHLIPGELGLTDAVIVVTTDGEEWEGYVSDIRTDGSVEVMFS